MNLSEAIAALEDDPKGIEVVTKSGAQYSIDRDVLLVGEDFVYGWRTNAAPSNRFKRGRGAENGDVRWFFLKNVNLLHNRG